MFNLVLGNPTLMGAFLLIGRLFMAAVFLTFGINKAIHTPQIQQYMAAHNVAGGLVYLSRPPETTCMDTLKGGRFCGAWTIPER